MISDWFFDYGIPIGAILLVIAVTGFIVMACNADIARGKRLMAECMADGKKEYECYSLLKQDTVTVPVVIPVGR